MLKYKRTEPGIDNVKLVAGVLAASEAYLQKGIELLQERFGAVDLAGEVVPFDYTTYYDREMGGNILRQFLSFQPLIYPGFLARIKRQTNKLELNEAVGGSRMVNLDPGYLTQSSLIVASTKPASFRIYLGHGIFAQPMLYYQDKTFQPYDWTYRDYRDQGHINFFNQIRAQYRQQMKMEKAEKNV